MAKEEPTRRRRRSAEPDAEVTETKGKMTKKVAIISSGEWVDGHMEETEIEVEEFISEPAYVRINVAQSKQPADYESVRVELSVTVPCYPQQIQNRMDHWKDYLGNVLADELDFYMGVDQEGNG